MTIISSRFLSEFKIITLRANLNHFFFFLIRHTRTREHTKTPPKHLKYSRRAWEGLVKAWRKKLHTYDPQDGIDKDNDNATF